MNFSKYCISRFKIYFTNLITFCDGISGNNLDLSCFKMSSLLSKKLDKYNMQKHIKTRILNSLYVLKYNFTTTLKYN